MTAKKNTIEKALIYQAQTHPKGLSSLPVVIQRYFANLQKKVGR